MKIILKYVCEIWVLIINVTLIVLQVSHIFLRNFSQLVKLTLECWRIWKQQSIKCNKLERKNQKNSADSCSFMNNNPVGEKYQTYLHKYGSQLCVFRLRSMVREAFVMSVICKPPFLPPVMFWRKKIINKYYLRTMALLNHIYWMQDPQIMET